MTRAQRAAAWTLGASLAVWIAWCSTPWGSVGTSLPLLNLVTPPRAAQTIGYAAALLLCLVLSRATRFGPGTALVVAGTCGLVTAYGVANLRAALPSLSTTEVWVAAVVVSACVGVVTLFPQRWWSVLPACLVLLWTGAQVNPVVFGLGDLRASGAAGAARQIGAAAREDGTFVASDDPFVSALLVANGAPSITGWQITGPRQEPWRVLDPDGSDEELWNRGASYLRMTFDGAPGAEPVIANPNPDIIQVSLDPCAIPAELDVRTLIASSKLDAPCLTLERTFDWSGRRQRVYSVADAGSARS